MPKRVIDFDAMWGSDKIAACAEWAQAEYAWLYGLADPSGCFEVTNLRVIWGRVAAIRRNLTIERLEQVFGEFQDKGLLFVWEQDGKRYGHWTGSDVPGRLPPPSWRMRLERLAPPVPKQLLAEYVSRFARGRAASLGGGFLGGAQDGEDRKPEISHLKQRGIAVAAGCGSEVSRGSGNVNAEPHVQGDLRFEISNLKREERAGENGVARGNADRGDGASVGACRISERPGEIAGATGRGEDESLGCGSGWRRLKDGVEKTHAQDLGLELDLERDGKRDEVGGAALRGWVADAVEASPKLFNDLDSKANSNAKAAEATTATVQLTLAGSGIHSSNESALLDSKSSSLATRHLSIQGSTPDSRAARTNAGCMSGGNPVSGRATKSYAGGRRANGAERDGGGKPEWSVAKEVAACATRENAFRNKAELLERELRVGQGPSSLGPVRVKPEALERIRLRDASRGGSRSG